MFCKSFDILNNYTRYHNNHFIYSICKICELVAKLFYRCVIHTYDQKERNMPWHYQKNVENDIL